MLASLIYTGMMIKSKLCLEGLLRNDSSMTVFVPNAKIGQRKYFTVLLRLFSTANQITSFSPSNSDMNMVLTELLGFT